MTCPIPKKGKYYNYVHLGQVEFPLSQSRRINMMPFVMGDPASLPLDLHPYRDMMNDCGVENTLLGEIGYISVWESDVIPGRSQRRPGIHTEAHPEASWGGGWGRGNVHDGRGYEGIYQASNASNSCRVWDMYIKAPGPQGDCSVLEVDWKKTTSHRLVRNGLYWMTDRTPHESTPPWMPVHRQWFRLVAGPVDVWYKDHSTENPLGTVPAPHTKIIEGDKFA